MFIEKISLNQLKELNQKEFFTSSEWLSIYDNTKLFICGLFNNNKELIGCFVCYNYKRAKILKQVSVPPFMPNNALLIEDSSSNPAQKSTFNKKVMELVSDFLEEQNAANKSLLFPYGFNDLQPFIWKKYSVGVKYSYLLNLTLTEEQLLANMSAERRKNIKKAINDGLLVNQEIDLGVFKNLIVNTFERQKIKIDYLLLDRLLTQFFNSDNANALVTYDKRGNAISANLTVFNNNRAYYLFGGYDQENKHEGAGALAMWEAIKIAKTKGIKTFDFEGSMIPQVEKFFRGFGGELTPYYKVNKSSFLFRLFIKVKNILS